MNDSDIFFSIFGHHLTPSLIAFRRKKALQGAQVMTPKLTPTAMSPQTKQKLLRRVSITIHRRKIIRVSVHFSRMNSLKQKEICEFLRCLFRSQFKITFMTLIPLFCIMTLSGQMWTRENVNLPCTQSDSRYLPNGTKSQENRESESSQHSSLEIKKDVE